MSEKTVLPSLARVVRGLVLLFWGVPALLLTGLVVAGGIWPTLLTGLSETATAPLALRSSDAVTVIAMAPSPTTSQQLPA